MKIAIIGAGFYGCYMAEKLGKDHLIDIYERNPKILINAMTNNQHRLHLGYHYPRASGTIDQVISCYDQFLNEFSDCVNFVDNNIYAIHKNSNVSFDDYKKIYDFYKILDHKEVKRSDKIWSKFKNPSDFQGALYTKEGTLDLEKLKLRCIQSVYSNNNINLYCSYEVNENNILELKSKYDYVINCTYNHPYIGFKNPPLETKSEHCLLAIMRDSNYADVGITIMDGPFCSLYPIRNDLFSLSSVIHTPFNKSDLTNFDLKSSLQNIIDHGEQYFLFKDKKIIDYYFGTKTKIKNDKNDQRESFVEIEDNLISVFSGKISAVIDSLDKVKNEIK